jgi:hypothetical protein
MNNRIIYQNDEGGVSVIVPVDPDMTVEQIAAKDVPAGKAYKIIDASDLPDRATRAEWDYDAIGNAP